MFYSVLDALSLGRSAPDRLPERVQVVKGNYRVFFEHGQNLLQQGDYELAHKSFLDSLMHNVDPHSQYADEPLALETYSLWGQACLKIPRLRGNARTNFLRLVKSDNPPFMAKGYVGLALLCESTGELEKAAYYAQEAEDTIEKFFVKDPELSKEVSDLTGRLNA